MIASGACRSCDSGAVPALSGSRGHSGRRSAKIVLSLGPWIVLVLYGMSRFSLVAVRLTVGISFFYTAWLPLSHATLPSGAEIIEGSAGLFEMRASYLVEQESDRVVIEWEDFSIGEGRRVTFDQPGAAAAALNRVVGGDPTEIHGELNANGKVYLINPNGVLVGSSGVIHAGSFIASTLDVDNDGFMGGGDLEFAVADDDLRSAVRNFGEIQALGGDVFLFAQRVENRGRLEARSGTAGLAAAGRLLLKSSGDRRIAVLAPPGAEAGEDEEASVWNTGQIRAASVELKAARGNHYALAINNEGVVRADTVEEDGGRIFLRAGSGDVSHTGQLDASGNRGGRVEVEGDNVEVADGGGIDTSGGGTEASGWIDVRGGNLLLNGTITGQGSMRYFAGQDIEIGPAGVIDNSGSVEATLFVVDHANPDRPGVGSGVFVNLGVLTPGNALGIFTAGPRDIRPRNVEGIVDEVVFDTWFGEPGEIVGNRLFFKSGPPLPDPSWSPAFDLYDRLAALYDWPVIPVSAAVFYYEEDPERREFAPELTEPGRLSETGLSSSGAFRRN